MMPNRIFFLALLAIAATARPLRAQDADDYAVWSAAIDAQLDRGGGLVRTVLAPGRTEEQDAERRATMRKILLGSVGDQPLVDHYLERNRTGTDIDARRLVTSRVRIVTRGSSERAVGQIELSLPGYDAARTHALVEVGTRCGGMCGDGVVLLMERGTDGRWREVRIVSSWMS